MVGLELRREPLMANHIDIFFFGFSRGAYIARFLAEMLDFVGLLEPGNEEMVRMAELVRSG